MDNKKSNSAIIILVIVAIIWALGSCSSGDSYTADDLRNAQERRANGEKLNREDSIMTDGFDKWKSEQDKYADY